MKKALILLLTGTLLMTSACSGKQPQKATVPTSGKTEEKLTIESFGVVKGTEIKNIAIDFPATVLKLHVKDGQAVKNGNALVTLDMSDYEAQITGKERQLTSEKLELQRLINSTAGEQNDVKRLQKELMVKQEALQANSDPDMQKYLNDQKNAESLYNKSLEELASKEKLYKSGAASLNELEEFKKGVDAKKKALEDIAYSIDIYRNSKQKEIDQLQANIDQKLSQLDNTQSSTEINRIKIQREKISGLELDIKLLRDKLSKSYLKQNDIICDVPNGLVYDIGYAAGDVLNQSKKLASIMNLDTIVVEANVAEEFIKDVKLGAEVVIVPLADKSKSYKGKVISISGKAIQKNGETYVPAQISIDNKDEFLRPDFNVDVTISIIK